MKKREAKKLIDSRLKEYLRQFNFKKKGDDFIKIIKGDFKIDFGYSIVDLGNSFPIQFGYHLSSVYLDRIFSAIRGVEEKGLNVYSNHQSLLFESKEYPILEYDVYTSEDIEEMVGEITKFLDNKALPYLESICDLEELEKVINNKPIPQKSEVGLVLARIMKNSDYNKLKEKYRELLIDWVDSYKESLEKTINFLDNHSVEELEIIAQGKKF